MCVCVCVCVSVSICLCLSVSVCLCVFVSIPRLSINSGVIHYMTVIIVMVSKCGLRIEVCHRNQPSKGKIALYRPLFSFNSHLKQLCIGNSEECFSYKSKCDVHGYMCTEAFKRRAGLCCRYCFGLLIM